VYASCSRSLLSLSSVVADQPDGSHTDQSERGRFVSYGVPMDSLLRFINDRVYPPSIRSSPIRNEQIQRRAQKVAGIEHTNVGGSLVNDDLACVLGPRVVVKRLQANAEQTKHEFCARDFRICRNGAGQDQKKY